MSDLRKPASRSTRIDDLIMQSPLLHWSEKLLYYSIKSQISQQKGVKNGEFSASKETLADSVGLSARTIQRLLKKWKESGYLSVKEANRFKPVKYELLEHVLLERVTAPAPGQGSNENGRQEGVQVRPLVIDVRQPDRLVGQQDSTVGQPDNLVRQSVSKVGHADALGKTGSLVDHAGGDEVTANQEQDWRTPETDDLVMQMGRKMNEISTDIMSKFVIDEKWLRFLTKDEYNHLVKISHDIKLKSGP